MGTNRKASAIELIRPQHHRVPPTDLEIEKLIAHNQVLGIANNVVERFCGRRRKPRKSISVS